MRELFRSSVRPAATALLGTLLAACSATGPTFNSTSTTGPDVPAAIAVPTGNTLAFRFKGSGLLNYECRARADGPGTYDWVAVAPDAVLKDRSDALVGKYYGGPTWEHADGSKVTGKPVATAPAPSPGNLPWQLVQATPVAGAMTMSGVTYVQRIETQGGVAPTDSCSAAVASSRKSVRFSADYLFYKR